MRKSILSLVCTAILAISIVPTVPTLAATSDVYYTTQHGVELTQTEYENLTKVYTPDELDCLPIPFIEQTKRDTQLQLVDSDEAFVVTKTYYNQDGQVTRSISREVSETEAMMGSAAPETKQSATIDTSYKQLTLKLVVGASINAKKVTITNKWLKLPKVRSFDVLAVRPGALSATLFTGDFSAAQNYDGKSITYSFYGDNTKAGTSWSTGQGGIGTSMNIVDNVSNSLSNSMAVTFTTGAVPFTIYGTYQHATSEVTLAQSKNYAFSSSGLGNVLKFASSVSDKYDAMKGISVTFDPDNL